ncbi:hypothetical protein BD289DRAFT_44780 [Coniella lustricola]|uniref:Uncharacterized protein n=1 Tax=Coniella lustricola TaxID=2025994 RepID=A0A2T3A1N3_9PEZI|nr:hypothetical protein BD289DRAFT_44780 [Coniella lustricola]
MYLMLRTKVVWNVLRLLEFLQRALNAGTRGWRNPAAAASRNGAAPNHRRCSGRLQWRKGSHIGENGHTQGTPRLCKGRCMTADGLIIGARGTSRIDASDRDRRSKGNGNGETGTRMCLPSTRVSRLDLKVQARLSILDSSVPIDALQTPTRPDQVEEETLALAGQRAASTMALH